MEMTGTKTRWMLALVVGSLMFPAFAGAEQSPEEARQHFQRGRDLEAAGNLAGALAEYQLAMELRPTFRLRSHMGRVCFGMGRFRDSLEHYQAFLREGGERLDAADEREAQEAVTEILVTVATLRVTAEEGATVLVDGVVVGETPMNEASLLDPGSHRIELRLEGFVNYSEQLEMGPGEERTLDVTLESLPEVPEPDSIQPVTPDPVVEGGTEEAVGTPDERRYIDRAAFWATMSVSAAMIVAGAVVGILAITRRNEYDDLNQSDRTDAQDERMQHLSDNLVPSMSLAADILLFTGAAGAVAAIIMAFFTDFSGESGESAARVSPLVTAGGAGLMLGGVF